MMQTIQKLADIDHVNMRPATADDAHLPAYDHTRLAAVSTCPTWGILRYVHNKTFVSSGRAMALEAGSAAHEVFAAARLWQLDRIQGLIEHSAHHGKRLFGADRYYNMCAACDENEDERNQMLNFCLAALQSSGFYDDPSDKRRTMSNIEESCIAYLDRLPHAKDPVWVADTSDPTSPIGIEIPINIVIDFGGEKQYRFIGRADGLHVRRDKLILGENKTASRLGDAWALSFQMSHQVTGYCMALSVMLSELVEEAMIHGMSIPLPRAYDYGGLMNEYVRRPQERWNEFLEWFFHCAQIIDMWKDDVHHAPKYTHSCNRYFRPCSFIPYCAIPVEERQEVYDEMVHDEWNPLEDEGSHD